MTEDVYRSAHHCHVSPRDSRVVPLGQRQRRHACDENRIDARDEQCVAVQPRELLDGPPYAGNDALRDAASLLLIQLLLPSRVGVDLRAVGRGRV